MHPLELHPGPCVRCGEWYTCTPAQHRALMCGSSMVLHTTGSPTADQLYCKNTSMVPMNVRSAASHGRSGKSYRTPRPHTRAITHTQVVAHSFNHAFPVLIQEREGGSHKERSCTLVLLVLPAWYLNQGILPLSLQRHSNHSHHNKHPHTQGRALPCTLTVLLCRARRRTAQQTVTLCLLTACPLSAFGKTKPGLYRVCKANEHVQN